MAYDKLTHGMALNGHILLGNHEFAYINGLTPAANFYPGQALHPRSRDPMAESQPEQRHRHRQDAIA
jgi:hypothetical protein